MKKNKLNKKYGLGGLLKKVGQGAANYGKVLADTTLTGIGMSDVITEDDYTGFGSNIASKFSDFNEKIQPIKNAIGMTALNAVAPGSGQIAQSIQQTGAQFNPQEELEQNRIQTKSSVRTLKCGGKLKRYQDGGELTEFNGLKHEQGGLPIGNIAEVEDGETRYSDFIFSDSINYDNKKTFAEQSKRINKKYELRPDDEFSKTSKERELNKLAETQEMFKGLNEQGYQTVFKKGGKLELVPSKDRYKSIIGNNNGRIKMDSGGFDPNKKYTEKELMDMQAVQVSNPPSEDNWIQVKSSDTSKTFYVLPGTSGELLTGKIKPSKIIGEDPGEKAGIDAIIRESKKIGKFAINTFPKYNDAALEIWKKSFTTPPKVQYLNPGLTEAPKLEYTPNVEENLELEPTESTYTTPKVDPLSPDWLGIGASAIPGLISGIGNLALADKVKYQRISPEQIRLQHLDPTRAVQEVTGQGNAVMSGIRQNARGIGSYLSNRLGALGTTQRATSNVYAKYDNANTEIDNREREINFNERVRALTANADIQQRELQDRLGFKAAGIEGIGNAATGSLDYYRDDKRFRDYQQLLQPNYLLGKVDGQTQVVPREWMENSMMRKNINLSTTPKINNSVNVEEDLQYEPLDNNYKIQPDYFDRNKGTWDDRIIIDDATMESGEWKPVKKFTAKYGGKLKLKNRSKK
jgi:hypothetical protein